MTDLPDAIRLLDRPSDAQDSVVLTYDERILRRKRLTTAQGDSFLVDLPATTSLDSYFGFELADGRVIKITAADEDLLQITGDLARVAWHIGNRHTPCQIEDHRLLIRRDHVLEAMLRQLGAAVTTITEPFTPEGGAYGHGRTMGHSHGPDTLHDHAPSQVGAHTHSHAQAHSHTHGKQHSHAHSHSGSHSHSHDNEGADDHAADIPDDRRNGPF